MKILRFLAWEMRKILQDMRLMKEIFMSILINGMRIKAKTDK